MLNQSDFKFHSCIQGIDANLYKRIHSKSYKENCTMPLKNLRYITLSHYGFDHCVHTGELIVHAAIAQKIICIFQELFDAEYPIEKMILVDDYDADDIRSMSDNNSSAFNFRFIEGTTKLSNHSKGLAIDINPLYNPYVRTVNGVVSILPENGSAYANRSYPCPYYIHKNDICYQIFLKYGFTWGGDWTISKDYQHFEIEPSSQ